MRKALWCLLLTVAAVFAQNPSSRNAAAPKVCSIPLLNVLLPGTPDKMYVDMPQAAAGGSGTVQVPAPACDSAVFANR